MIWPEPGVDLDPESDPFFLQLLYFAKVALSSSSLSLILTLDFTVIVKLI